MALSFVSFPSIESFHNAVRAVNAYPHITGESSVVKYRGKIKLHGTNAGVRVGLNGEFAAQSRTQIITPTSDNAGFAKWVYENESYWKVLSKLFEDLKLGEVTIFGEWCGPGIMKGTAINQISKKAFVIFAIHLGSAENGKMIVNPYEIDRLVGGMNEETGIYVLPWYGELITVDFNLRSQLQEVADKLNKVVEEVEPCDPWVKKIFGIEGTAEGVVYYPSENEVIPRKRFSDLAFKAKGEKHKVVKNKQSVQVDPEVVASVDEFITMFVTDARLEQGVAATGDIHMRNIGNFLKWFGQDVLKESVAELEAAGLEWEQVTKPVQTAARNWYMRKAKEV